MTEQPNVSRSGHPVLSFNGINLHSRYDPQKEAERFVESSLQDANERRTIIILGEGLGYIGSYIGGKYPGARLVSVYYSTAIFDRRMFTPETVWHPSIGTGIKAFFESIIDETDCEGLAVLEWQPSKSIFPVIANEIRDALNQVLRELKGSVITTQAMGKRWIKNSIANFVSLANVSGFSARSRKRLAIVVGSGPSAEKSGIFLKRSRDGLFIIALPSSCSFLSSLDIQPDIIVLTDPGYYSLVHLFGSRMKESVICMPLSAARGIWKTGCRTAFVLQPYFFESDLLRTVHGRFPFIHPQGTVAATAIQLALMISESRVVCIGLDFCSYDIQFHVRPSAFEELLTLRTIRTNPAYNLMYQRAIGLTSRKTGKDRYRTSLPLMTYAGWFNHLPRSQSDRLVQFNPSPAGLNKLPSISEHELLELVIQERSREHVPVVIDIEGFPTHDKRRAMTRRVLDDWKHILLATRNMDRRSSENPLMIEKKASEILYYFDTEMHSTINRLYRKGSFDKMSETHMSTVDDACSFIDELQERYTTVV